MNFASFGRAGESANPMIAAREILESMRGQVQDIENTLAYISGTGGNAGQVFYRSPQITLLKVRFPAGRHAAAQSRRMGDDPAVIRRRKEYALPPRQWHAAQSWGDDDDARRDTAHARRNHSRG